MSAQTCSLTLPTRTSFLDTFVDPYRFTTCSTAGMYFTPSDRDYSYDLKVHDVYTRIDPIWVDHLALELLQASSIGSLTISDHAPATATLDVQPGASRAWSRRFNKSLLDDAAEVSGVTDVLSHYFKENKTEGVSKGIVWEGHKAVVRGELFSQGSRLKKVQQANVTRVLQVLQKA